MYVSGHSEVGYMTTNDPPKAFCLLRGLKH